MVAVGLVVDVSDRSFSCRWLGHISLLRDDGVRKSNYVSNQSAPQSSSRNVSGARVGLQRGRWCVGLQLNAISLPCPAWPRPALRPTTTESGEGSSIQRYIDIELQVADTRKAAIASQKVQVHVLAVERIDQAVVSCPTSSCITGTVERLIRRNRRRTTTARQRQTPVECHCLENGQEASPSRLRQ